MPNRLEGETSPYLLQHANNPVDWYPWGPEALEKARTEAKPILLSVGYSACHWCHVMERESFEDEQAAAFMNQHFVAIKVDREERPDLDEIYMHAVQAFTGGHGGWPMTLFLTPDGRPFLGGTYFPPEARQGIPSFRELMEHAHTQWTTNREEVEGLAGQVSERLKELGRLPVVDDYALHPIWLDAVSEAAEDDFDEDHGGFGDAPKFPPHQRIACLMAHYHRRGAEHSLRMALQTLDGMALGGMYDLLGGGFARYSVDDKWLIPHFEKMLYDNAQLIPLYVDAWRITRRAAYHRIVGETVGWAMREMLLPEGCFAASQDADSVDGSGSSQEGAFFVWSPEEIREHVGILNGIRVCSLLNVTVRGTFEHGRSVLRLERPFDEHEGRDREVLEEAKTKLFEAREKRPRPGRDDKVVVSWNGMFIRALARAGAALDEPAWISAAERAAIFILETMLPEGRLHRTWKEGRLGPPGVLDDYANLLDALIELHQATLNEHWLREALTLAGRMVELFWDGEGFFTTGKDATPLVARSRNLIGGAVPSGTGAAAYALARLGSLTGSAEWNRYAETVLVRLQPLVERAPHALGIEALAAAWMTGPCQELGLVDADPLLLHMWRGRYLPFGVAATPTFRIAWMIGKRQAGAYLCERGTCRAPTDDPEELSRKLAEATQIQAAPDPGQGRDPSPKLPNKPEDWVNKPPRSVHGNVVVLHFWTSSCINCIHVLSELAAVEQRFSGDSVVFLGVHSGKFTTEKQRDHVEASMERLGVGHSVLLDPDHEVWKAFGDTPIGRDQAYRTRARAVAVKGWPTVVLIDAHGRIAWMKSGEVDRRTLARQIDRLLREDGVGEPARKSPPPSQATTSGLRFPGKLQVWPAAQAQAQGETPEWLYISDTGNHRILEARLHFDEDGGWPTAEVIRYYGDGTPGDRDGQNPRFRSPQGISRQDDVLWVADTGNHRLRQIDLRNDAATTAAGTGVLGRGGDFDPKAPLGVSLRSPWDVEIAGDVLFLAMAGAHQIWLYNPDHQTLGPFLGSGNEGHVDGDPSEAQLAQPSALCVGGRYLFWADAETSSIRLMDLEENRVASLVGRGLFDFGDIDGSPDEARLQHPRGLTFAGEDLWLADTFNGKVKSLSLNGEGVTTVASGLSHPGGISAAGDFMLVADTDAHRLVAIHRETGELRPLPLNGLID